MPRIIVMTMLGLLLGRMAWAAEPMLWIEGEEPIERTVVPNQGLDDVDTQELSGGAWLSSFANGQQPTGTARYAATIPAPGSYRLWVRGTGGLAVRVGDGAWKAVDRKKATCHLTIAANGNHGYPTIDWFDLGAVDLPAGQVSITWRLGPAEGNGRYGSIDCFVLTQSAFKPNDKYKPGESPPFIPAFAKGACWDFAPGRDAFSDEAVLDLRRLNEKVAGEHGFVRLAVDGESLVRGDGKPLRLWSSGVRTSRTELPDLRRRARFLAKRGVNALRVFAMLPSKTRDVTAVNPRELDSVFRHVAAAKDEGIYTIIDGYWGGYTKRHKGWDVMGSGKDNLEALVFFDPKTQAAYKAWMKALLTTPNPYTGLKLAEEPAVAIVQLQNEDSLLWWGFSGLRGEALTTLRKRYLDFLVEKYGSGAEALQAWQNYHTDDEDDDFRDGLPGFLHVWDFTNDAWVKKHTWPGFLARSADQLEFQTMLMRKFNAAMVDYLRNELHVNQLINANNWRTVDLTTTQDAQYYADAVCDVMARNIYVGGEHRGLQVGWQILPGQHYSDRSLLKHPELLPTNVRQAVSRAYILPEALWVPPNLYQAEAPMLVAAQQSLNGIAAVCWFSNQTEEWSASPRTKWTHSTPMQIGQFPAAALIHRMGYLRQAEPVVVEHRSGRDLWQRKVPLTSEEPGWDANRDLGRERVAGADAMVDRLAYLVGPVRVAFDGQTTKTKVRDLSPYIDRQKKVVRSLTGEIEVDWGTGLCRINAPKAQAAAGFLGQAGPQTLTDVKIACRTRYASLAVVSMDDKPLRVSDKVLIQVGTLARPSGWVARPARLKTGDAWKDVLRIVSIGEKPWQVGNIDAMVTIANPRLKKVVALDANGMISPIDVRAASAGGKLTVTVPNGTLYLVASGDESTW